MKKKAIINCVSWCWTSWNLQQWQESDKKSAQRKRELSPSDWGVPGASPGKAVEVQNREWSNDWAAAGGSEQKYAERGRERVAQAIFSFQAAGAEWERDQGAERDDR